MEFNKEHTAILILAAGKASRMGELKQLLPWHKNTLLGHSIANALSYSHNVYVVIGAESESIKKQIKDNVTFVENTNYKEGLGTSIACGIDAISKHKPSYKNCLVLLADQPFIDTEFIKKILESHYQNNTKITGTSYKNGVGVPVVFNSEYFTELKKITGDQGAKEILKKYKSEVNSIPSFGKTIDIDTKEAYLKYLNNNFK